jgi:hypothetical protein
VKKKWRLTRTCEWSQIKWVYRRFVMLIAGEHFCCFNTYVRDKQEKDESVQVKDKNHYRPDCHESGNMILYRL